ncbi:MAG: TlpA disulfide reductase family protein [Anaerolineales bacterium]
MKNLSKTDKYWNIFVFITLVLAAGWIVFTSLFFLKEENKASVAPITGFQAPDFQLNTEDGQSIRLATLQGKPVILNFWASWCLPCKSEIPALEKVHQQYVDRVVILGVNVTINDHLPVASRFLQESMITFPVVWDVQGSTTSRYGVSALPTTFFLDRYGRIQNVIIGGPMSEALLIAEVEKLSKVE